MTLKSLSILCLFTFSITCAHAAGEPLNEDFTDLIGMTTATIEVGKQGKLDEFLASLETALDKVKAQTVNGDSPKLQRVSTRLKTAKRLGKKGQIKEATAAAEQALQVIN